MGMHDKKKPAQAYFSTLDRNRAGEGMMDSPEDAIRPQISGGGCQKEMLA